MPNNNTRRTIQPVMISMDRSPNENYLERTLDNLNKATHAQLDNLIVSDSHNSAYVSILALRREGYKYVEHEPYMCANLNVADALEQGASTDAEFVLFLEDDIDFIGDFLNSVSRWLDDHVSSLPIIYPLGANYDQVQQGFRRNETYWSYPVTQLYGTQAFIIRSRDVPSCCEYLRAHCYDLHEDGTRYDHLIRDWMLSNGVTHIPTPCPSFVQHIGTTSIIKRRSAIHTFPSFPGNEYVYKGVDEINAKDTICVVTPARNAIAHLELYFKQLDELRNELGSDYHLRLVIAEGDSVDGTRQAFGEYANRLKLDYTLIDTTHGGKYYRSVEDSKRLAMMSKVMSQGLSTVRDSDVVVVWLMVDVRYDALEMKDRILDHRILNGAPENRTEQDALCIQAPLALNHDGTYFWDTWAFRKDGKRFNQQPPFCESDEFLHVGLTEIDSAGTCLIMPGEIARNKSFYPSTDEAVEFCNNVRTVGHKIYTHPDWRVYHNYHANKQALVLGSFGNTSGYSRCVASLLPPLAAQGYEIDLIAVDWPAQRPNNLPWNIWSAQQSSGDSIYGAHQLYRMLVSHSYDVCVILTDVFNVPSYSQAILDARKESPNKGSNCTIAWCAVDSCNQLTTPALNAKDNDGSTAFDHVIVWTEFARNELTAQGCELPIDVIPLGVDTNVFTLGDKSSKRPAREKLLVEPCKGTGTDTSLIPSAFIVGFVGRNQARKQPQLAIEAFAKFTRANPDCNAYLVMHCNPGNGAMGCDIEGVARYYNLAPGQVIKYETLLDDNSMAMFYRMIDVLLVTSTGEGWCLPVLESLACGTPAIVPGFGPLAEWAKGNVLECNTIADVVMAPSNTAPYTMGRLIDVVDCANCLEAVGIRGYSNVIPGRELAESFDSQLVYTRLATRIDQLATVIQQVTPTPDTVAPTKPTAPPIRIRTGSEVPKIDFPVEAT
jgi:glycosyltransferase involved in cell wall biosynthesis